ncbi:2,3-diphosphoglycerate-dependent phosphoglycerate mutase [Corallococcus exiguus]|uniref:2,3-bisphosphoglycerate-dependent phosphoglycerate mutase n=1 Tax=Corallococcus exiguus TaxID=83462 RepID=A0A7X4Y9Y8_9BACT|nr:MULTISPECIES: 2,3-diphosphoglycerate-dependent phosphoglycerate mutase [Corallococcus]NBC41598.1 2,3-bisphosphoglycerate-dependent phosphoglycerate mutase [Corallococcus exiguus]NNC21262.1 2,3-diphosphoglycerate-dependent phosphoglycerate mutase [Corallococcus exiguus]NRD67642.1 2,3-diphosphoglycerate-dependent phosphoglycerate mutase [Corallococcus exiguus]RKH16063.1 2,3-diphosphoglycerate-dependent phosphoglycerate mutase [Corallococcus sp. CA041A]RKH97920.1 2,3-diphosphoglycerate-depende
MPILALVRHGQSLWNLENRFTGFVDVPLTEQGRAEARKAADALQDVKFDVAYTSALSRAQQTLAILLEALKQTPPVIRDAALNERHYGDLQGLNKADAAKEFGEKQVHVWRRSFDVPPPNGESLEMTAKRVLPFFDRAIAGDLRQGKNVLVVAHGNSNRSLVMRLDKLSGETVVGLELATGVPLVYEIGADGQVVSKRG